MPSKTLQGPEWWTLDPEEISGPFHHTRLQLHVSLYAHSKLNPLNENRSPQTTRTILMDTSLTSMVLWFVLDDC